MRPASIAAAVAAVVVATLAPNPVLGQAAPTVIRPSATLGPAATPADAKAGQGSPKGTAQGGALGGAAAASGPPVFSHRGLPNRFRSVIKDETVLFDAPSDKARKAYIAPAGMPVEVISVLRDWVKFRDLDGDLAWLNREMLSDRRTVVSTAPVSLRREPRPEAEALFDVDRGVLFDLLEDRPTGGFARVRYATGEIGYLPVDSVWGL